GEGEVGGGERGEVRELALGDRALRLVFAREPRRTRRVEPERSAAVEPVRLRIERRPADRLAADQPVERHERVVAGDARRVRAGADRDAELEHAPDRRGGRGGPRAPAPDGRPAPARRSGRGGGATTRG